MNAFAHPSRARPSGAASAKAPPAPRGPPSQSGVGPPGGGAPRPRAATSAAPRSWSPSAAPTTQAIPAPGRSSDRAVVSAIHRSSASAPPSANPQLGAYGRLSGTHTVIRTCVVAGQARAQPLGTQDRIHGLVRLKPRVSCLFGSFGATAVRPSEKPSVPAVEVWVAGHRLEGREAVCGGGEPPVVLAVGVEVDHSGDPGQA